VGLDRSALLRDLGVAVITLPLEIHPEIPVGGLSLAERWHGRYREAMAMYERIEAQCEAAGLPFRRPERVPNTHRALAAAEWVRQETPGAFDALERAMFEAQFVEQQPLDDPDVVDALVTAAGADASAARRAVDAGEVDDSLRGAAVAAASLGVTATPTWLIGRRVVIPGAAAREVFQSTVSRLVEPDASSPPSPS
jgi:predicted DsbA family dithiol-disulfide isomerase